MVKLLGDDPTDGTNEFPDLLERKRYAREIACLLDRLRGDAESSVISLVGPWGSGKTSVLKMIENQLKEENRQPEWVVAAFNPWVYTSVAAMQVAFFTELYAAMPNTRKWKTAREQLGSLGKKLAPLGSLVPGADLTGAINIVSDSLIGDKGISETRAEAETELRRLGKPILVVMDDLDRLTPEELLFVFKLVRLVGRLPNVYYVLSFDEQTLLDVLGRTEFIGQHSKDQATSARAQDYLEKIIQVRCDLPAFRESQAQELINSALKFVMARNGVELDPPGLKRMQEALTQYLLPHLDTPRSINRYFGQVDALYGLVGEEIDFVDFLLITWLRAAEPVAYSKLYRYKAELTGIPSATWITGKSKDFSEIVALWKGRLAPWIRPERIDAVLGIMGYLFLPVKSALSGMEYAGSWVDEMADRRGVGHFDYFDRYFSFGVHNDDMSDERLQASVMSLGSADVTLNRKWLEDALVSETALVCRKLTSLVRSDSSVPLVKLIELMGSACQRMPQSPLQPFSPRHVLESQAAKFFERVTPDEALELIERHSVAVEDLYFYASVVARFVMDHASDDAGVWSQRLDVVAESMGELIKARLNCLNGEPLSAIDDEDRQLISNWRHVDQSGWSSWYKSQLSDGWSLIDLVMDLVREDWREAGSPFPPLSMSSVDWLLDLDYVLDSLDGQLASAVVPFPQPASCSAWDERRLFAKELLRRERERRLGTIAPD